MLIAIESIHVAFYHNMKHAARNYSFGPVRADTCVYKAM